MRLPADVRLSLKYKAPTYRGHRFVSHDCIKVLVQNGIWSALWWAFKVEGSEDHVTGRLLLSFRSIRAVDRP